MLAAVVAVLVTLVFGVTLWSLRSNVRTRDAATELHNVDRIARADGLDQLPPDYSKIAPPKPPEPAAPTVPVLGEPLPGDLGNAMLRAERGNSDSRIPGLGTPTPPDPNLQAARAEQLAREREAEDAAKAPLFFRGSQRHGPAGSAPSATAASASPNPSEVVGAPNAPTRLANSGSGKNLPDAKSDFLARGSDGAALSSHALQPPLSPYQVMAGTVISAALITGINSDLPGQILATVTEPVYDTRLGQYLLIPQGTRLIGEYDSQVAFGQRRVLLVWNRLIFPDASSLNLDRLAGVDAAGDAGLEDGVDRHWRQLLGGAVLSTLIGVAAELAAPDRSNGQSQVVVSTRQSVQDSINQVGQELTRRNLNVQPTLTIRAGYPLRVIVSKDIVLRPYQPLFTDHSTP
jgi:type IV secretion system protein VirB10